MDLADKFRVKPRGRVSLDRYDTAETPGFKSKHAAEKALHANIARLADLQYLLYAENKRALLVVFQGTDAAGKDGVIRHVMSGVNPQGCRVTSFKTPSAEEADHGFLWRIHKAVPPKGEIGIFNRSHYEDVLIVRIHKLVPKSVWSKRFKEINAFEELLASQDVVILKFFLHISKDEQKARFRERLDDKEKNWKVSPADLEERKFWDDYTAAYEDVLSKTSTRHAPWFVIPSDRKWYRNLAVSTIITEALASLDMKFPPPPADLDRVVLK